MTPKSIDDPIPEASTSEPSTPGHNTPPIDPNETSGFGDTKRTEPFSNKHLSDAKLRILAETIGRITSEHEVVGVDEETGDRMTPEQIIETIKKLAKT